MRRQERARLIERLADPDYRQPYAESVLDSTIAAQIKANRASRGWNQEDLAEHAGMKQSRISAMEDVNYGSWSLSTLKRLARAFDLRLVVRFESFSSLLNGIRTRGELESFDQDLLVRPSFEKDAGLLAPVEHTAGATATKSEEIPAPSPPLRLTSQAGSIGSSIGNTM